MKAKDLIILFVIILSGFAIYTISCLAMGIPVFSNSKALVYVQPIRTGHEGEKIPSIDMLLADSITYLNVRESTQGGPVVLLYFGPDCPFCQAEVKDIIDDIDNLKEIQFYLLTPYSYADMKRFIDRYNLEKYSNIKVGIDYKFEFGKYFSAKNVPYIAIYGEDGVLSAAFIGNIKNTQLMAVAKG